MSELLKKYRLDPNIFSNEKDPDTTVCIVGKSTSLINKGLGELIDSHDIVVRINPWYTLYGNITPEDRGKKTNHITSSPYHMLRNCLNNPKILEQVELELSRMTDAGDYKKTLYINRIPDESWFRYRNNGPFLGLEHGEFTILQKLENYEKALNLCEKFGVKLKIAKMTNLIKSINDIMLYFNTDVNNPHGILSGTETVLYYMENFKNVSVAGFSWSQKGIDECKRGFSVGITQTHYDLFFLNEALNRGLITKLEDRQ